MKVIKKLKLSKDFTEKLLATINDEGSAATVLYVRKLVYDAFELGVNCDEKNFGEQK